MHGPARRSRPLPVHFRFACLRDFVETRGRPTTLRSYRFSSVDVRAAVGRPRRYEEYGSSVLHGVISQTGHLSVDDRRCGCRSPQRGTPVRRPPTRAGFGDKPSPCGKRVLQVLASALQQEHARPCARGGLQVWRGRGSSGHSSLREGSEGGGVALFSRMHLRRAACPARPCVCIVVAHLAAGCTGRRVFQAPASTSAAQTAGGTS